MSTSRHSSYVSIPSSYGYLCPCHIFNVVSTAILSILLILSTVSALVLSNKVKIHVRALINRFLSVSLPINSSKSSCTRLLNISRKSKTLSIESVSILFFQLVLFKFLINLFKDQCGVNPTVDLYLFETKKIFSWCHFKIDQWYCRVFISTNFPSFFCLKIYFWGLFLPKKPSVCSFHLLFFFVGIKKILFKLSKSDFLINISGHEFLRMVFLFFLQVSVYQIMCQIFDFSLTDSIAARKFF